MGRARKPAASPKAAVSDRGDLASPESTVAAEEADLELESPEVASVDPPRVRMSGEELKAKLRQERREQRLAEKGY